MTEQQAHATAPFENLSFEALLEIDKAAGAIIDGSGFGTLSIDFEYMTMKRIVSTVTRKVNVPHKVA